MNFKNIFYSFLTLLLLSFTAKAEIFNRQDISTITIENLQYRHQGLFERSVLIKITADSIFLPHRICTDYVTKCFSDRSEELYLGSHDIFKFVPEMYLKESRYILPSSRSSGSTKKLEICFVDGRCHIWNMGSKWQTENKETQLFENKIQQILSGNSKYQFNFKAIPVIPDAIFDKKNLRSVNIYRLNNYPFSEVLLYTITADSVTKHPFKSCSLIRGKFECWTQNEKIQYQDKFNIYKAFPTLFLSGSEFVDPRKDNNEIMSPETYKIENCFADGQCNIWSISAAQSYYDDETNVFLDKIFQLISDQTTFKK